MGAGIAVLIFLIILAFLGAYYGTRVWNFIQARGIRRSEWIVIFFLMVVAIIIYFGQVRS